MSSLSQDYNPSRLVRYAPLIVAVSLFLISWPVVGLRGDFPLNDDWAYANSVRALVWAHDWRPSGWAAMNLLTQSLWGAPFCALTSCSFEDLRLSSLTATIVVAMFSYLLFELAGAPVWIMTAAVILVVFNPIIYELSYTFMTDVFFAMAATASAYFLIRSLKTDSGRLLILGTFFAVIAILCRQVGICLLAGYAVARFLQGGRCVRRCATAALPLAVGVLVATAFPAWLRHSGRLSPQYNNVVGYIASHSVYGMPPVSPGNLALFLLYVGLFVSPVLLLTKPIDVAPAGLRRWAPIVVSGAFCAISVIELIHHRELIPKDNSIFLPSGLGPLILHDTAILKLQDVPPLPIALRACMTALALFGQFVLVKRMAAFLIGVWDRRDRFALDRADSGPLMALAAIAIYTGPLLLIYIFDRYLAPLLPLVFYWIIATARPRDKGVFHQLAAGAIVLASVLFAVLGTHDYLAWNRARWEAIAALERSGRADARNLDGGFEYNGLRGFDPNYVPRADKSWWWVKDDEYLIAFRPIAGYATLARYDYRNLLPPEQRAIFVLQKQAAPSTPPR
jgi:hypothetical protein